MRCYREREKTERFSSLDTSAPSLHRLVKEIGKFIKLPDAVRKRESRKRILYIEYLGTDRKGGRIRMCPGVMESRF